MNLSKAFNQLNDLHYVDVNGTRTKHILVVDDFIKQADKLHLVGHAKLVYNKFKHIVKINKGNLFDPKITSVIFGSRNINIGTEENPVMKSYYGFVLIDLDQRREFLSVYPRPYGKASGSNDLYHKSRMFVRTEKLVEGKMTDINNVFIVKNRKVKAQQIYERAMKKYLEKKEREARKRKIEQECFDAVYGYMKNLYDAHQDDDSMLGLEIRKNRGILTETDKEYLNSFKPKHKRPYRDIDTSASEAKYRNQFQNLNEAKQRSYALSLQDVKDIINDPEVQAKLKKLAE